ncbi:MAG: GlsB/YeaQ/YmgE family stress response membrane protein [Clostridia bacterium]|nr:GlsB/YeaQ/YmgE family stress response membrane protein [Clostridia bacterium]
MLLHLIASLVIGALSGAVANKIMHGNPKGFFQNALLGIIGGLVGGFLGNLIGVGSDGWVSSILLAIAGSCLVVWLARKIAK